ncbi:MAG: hypothetical protein U0401_34325 [Anaerolineae bacterium]
MKKINLDHHPAAAGANHRRRAGPGPWRVKSTLSRPADLLSAIAKKEYGNSQAFPTIVEATNAKAAEDSSFAVIKDAKAILVGQKLWLPVQPIPETTINSQVITKTTATA